VSGPWEKYGTPKAAPEGPWLKYKTEEPRADPTEGMSGAQLAAAGAGKAFADMGLGVRQRAAAVADLASGPLEAGPGVDNSSRFPRSQAIAEEVRESRERDAPLMATGAGAAGNIGGNLALMAPAAAIPGINTIAGSTALGAGLGAMQPVESIDEAGANTLISGGMGAIGSGIARSIGAIVRPSNMTAAARRAAAPILDEGGRLTPGQASGSQTLQQIEASMGSYPPTAGAFSRIRQGNQSVINRMASRAIGENADAITDDILQNANKRIGDVYEKVASDRPVSVDPNAMLNRITDIDQNLKNVVNVADEPLVDEALRIAQAGGATGKQLQHLSNRLRVKAEGMMRSPTGDRELGRALFQVREVIDDQLQGSLPVVQREAFRQARDQYKNMMLLTASKNVLNEATGDVSARNLASVLRSKDRSGYLFGRARTPETRGLHEVARFGRSFAPAVGDSGTATRSFLPQVLGTTALGGGATAVAGGDPVTGAAAGAALPLVLAAAARGYTSPVVVNYVMRGLPAFQASPAVAQRIGAATTMLPIAAANSGE
jgi:hypothetical protein